LGGTIDTATIFSGGLATIEVGGVDSGSTISQGGTEIVFGSANGDIVGGTPIVSAASAVATNETVVSGGGDIFRDTAADLTGSTIRDFLPSDSIDLINLAEAHARVSYNAGTSGLSVTDGYHTAAITLAGSFSAGGFSLASDGNRGTSVLYHAT
jgi:hypothetical protein